MSQFVDLSRRFRELTQAELDEPELLALANDERYLPSLGWSDLIEHPRVLVLAEAGSGKTREMQEQVARLRIEGKHAFFLALESLDRESLTDCLGAGDEKLFHAWKLAGGAEGLFFLDAVDELRLTQGKLERALRHFAKALDGFMNQISVVVTCRPSDWRPTVDMVTMQETLPYVPTEASPPPEDEVFLAALTEARGSRTKESKPKSVGFKAIALLPLGERQITTFAASLGVSDTDAFIQEIRAQDAWTFARRPLDLSELAATWNSSGKLGTRTEQHEANANAKLKDDSGRSDAGQLSDARARDGAERLALAIALTRTRTIRVPEQSILVQCADGALDAAAILGDWDHVQRRALLSRAIFDPATYGRVRFHHPSVQEYLAAWRLRRLREKGISTKALFRFLFAERYGVQVAVPSMRPIAAWLALWDPTVRNELMRREPEVLLSAGDPETLTVEMRATLVRKFAEAYSTGGWRGVRIASEELRRLAHPELANTIKEVWGKGPLNSDIRDLLLRLIYEGGIVGCADIAERAAANVKFSDYERIIAVRGILVCNRQDKARKIAQSICGQHRNWPNRVVHGVAADLFPVAFSVDQLLELVRRIPEPPNSASGFNWQIREIAQKIDAASPVAVELTQKLAAVIWDGRAGKQTFYEIKGDFNYLAAGLALLCHRRLSGNPAGPSDPDLMRACAVANQFGKDETGGREPLGELRTHFREDPELRAAAFWAEVDLMEELTLPKTDRDRIHFAEHDGLVSELMDVDRRWLEVALSDRSNPRRRGVALQALARMWWRRGRNESEGRALVNAVHDDADFRCEAITLVTPLPENPESRKTNEDQAQRRLTRELREKKRLANWKKWRKSVKSNPAKAFSVTQVNLTLSHLYKWLSARPVAHNRYDVWDRTAIAQAFGEDIARRATEAFQQYWRTVRPALWTERGPEERNSTPWVWLYGLCGIAAEASAPKWAAHLTSPDAKAAARYATLELNGFPAWLAALVKEHPSEVDAVIGAELTAQIALAQDYQHLPMLQDLTHAEAPIKQLLAPRCQVGLLNWPATFATDAGSSHSLHNLGQVLQVLADAAPSTAHPTIASECARRFAVAPKDQLGLVWLRGLFRFDPVTGVRKMRQGLAAISRAERPQRAVELLASLFGDREGIPLAVQDNATRAIILKQMLVVAYQYVRPLDDKRHEGVYTPNTRDHAESARSFLLQTLLDTPGPDARNVTLELAGSPLFAHFPDRLRYLARERAAKDAEFAPFSPAQIAELDHKYEMPPHDRDGLFEVMMDRLDDLAHDIVHHDFTDRRTVGTIKHESEMQRYLARRLADMAHGTYIVIREEEVADAKTTDIRLAAIRGNQRAVIEVKIADKRWTIADFERALRNQLVGQYLRHRSCKAGCLLLTYDGSKKYWQRPKKSGRVSFRDLLAHLNNIAKREMTKSNHEYCLSVFGLDLTEPVLAPAHRK
ncbi:MAG: uncharacterized protein JWO88_3602 [Frankiales bacterium]|nr:uncharacterized protein [Frankiales bacterium]